VTNGHCHSFENYKMKTITGGCASGAIRYEVTAEPIVTFNSHYAIARKQPAARTRLFFTALRTGSRLPRARRNTLAQAAK
jgi:hypothetical protein